MKCMKSQGELWTTTEEGVGAITVVLLREAGGGSWVLDEGVYLGYREGTGPSGSLPAPSEVGPFWSQGLVF